MKQKVGLAVFWTIILIHVVTGLFSVRSWPLTDYPMFNTPIEGPPVKIERLILVDHFPDGHSVAWTKDNYRILGVSDQRLHWSYRNKDWDALKNRLKVLAQERNYLTLPAKIEILLKTVTLQNGERSEKIESLIEYRIEDLFTH